MTAPAAALASSRRPAALLAGPAVGVVGLLAVVLIFVPGVARSGQEPAFTAEPGQVLAFFRSVSSPLAQEDR